MTYKYHLRIGSELKAKKSEIDIKSRSVISLWLKYQLNCYIIYAIS